MRPSFIIVACLAVGMLAGGVMLVFFPQSFGLTPNSGNQVKTSGKALIGGAFSLTDQRGNKVTEKTYPGKFKLIFFGYTYCPDVCPTELQVMSIALDILGKKADRVQPIFITIDPERDTVAQLGDYMSNFHDSFVGLTGTAEEIKVAAKAYRIFYAKAENEKSPKDYLMDHSSIIYLLDKQGNFVKHFNFGVKPEELAAEIGKFL